MNINSLEIRDIAKSIIILSDSLNKSNDANYIKECVTKLYKQASTMKEKCSQIIDDCNQEIRQSCHHNLVRYDDCDPCRTSFQCTKCRVII